MLSITKYGTVTGCGVYISASCERILTKLYGGVDSGLGTNPSDFDGDPFQDSNPQFMDPDDPDSVHIAAVPSPLCSPGGSTIFDGGLCCPSADFLVTAAGEARCRQFGAIA